MRRLIGHRPSGSSVVALVALFVALSGSAYAAGQIGSQQLQPGAVTTEKIKNGAVTTSKLADGAVTARKLAPSQRSAGFATSVPDQLALPATADTSVASLSLPATGNYIITAAVALGSDGAGGLISCQLLDNNNPIATGNGYLPAMAAFSQTITLTTASSGGSISLTCSPDTASQAKSRAITAVRVGRLTTQ